LVNDLKADLFTICETWLSVNDSAVLNELTPTGYNTLYHCPRSGRRGGGTALLVRKGFVTSKISCIEKSSFELSESVLDKHAPVRVRHLKSQSRPPWFNDEIVKARRERRSAERKWRASRLNSDLAVFKAKRNFALHVMNESRRAYYKQYIDENSSDQGRLFRASKRLLNFHVDRALPPHSDARMLANEMGEYFVHKITAIRSALDA
ncbi:unnamed protein product, partial [Porites evermanni]